MFKPEAFLNPTVFDAAERMLINDNVRIISKQRIHLNHNQVLGIWKKRCFDPFSYWTMLEACENKEFEIWMAEGDNSIEICRKNKKELRKYFAYSFVCNGVHSPGSAEEYKDNMAVIKCGQPFEFPPLFFSLSKQIEDSKRKINDDDLKNCIREFIKVKEEQIIESGDDLKGKYRITVEIDNIHWLTEYALDLYNCIGDISLLDAYIYATNIVEFDTAMVYAGEELAVVNEIRDSLQQLGLLVQIEQG